MSIFSIYVVSSVYEDIYGSLFITCNHGNGAIISFNAQTQLVKNLLKILNKYKILKNGILTLKNEILKHADFASEGIKSRLLVFR